MAVTVVQLGSPRTAGEGLRIGTVRRPPRGVEEVGVRVAGLLRRLAAGACAERGSPSLGDVEALDRRTLEDFRAAIPGRDGGARPCQAGGAARALAKTTDFSIGCYCDDESRCHRSILIDLVRSGGASRRTKEEPDDGDTGQRPVLPGPRDRPDHRMRPRHQARRDRRARRDGRATRSSPTRCACSTRRIPAAFSAWAATSIPASGPGSSRWRPAPCCWEWSRRRSDGG